MIFKIIQTFAFRIHIFEIYCGTNSKQWNLFKQFHTFAQK